MKIVICLFLIIVSCISSIAQIKMTEELRIKLDGKSKFHDVKNIVISHYEEELKKLSPRDSIQRKSIMRNLKMWNREFWINEYYTDENDEVKPQSKVIMDALAIRERDEPKVKHRNQPEGWVFNGPYDCDNGIGRIDRLAFHPTNPDIVFAGSPLGGLFKSTNGGNNWEPISEYVASLGVAGIAVHPTNPNILYVMTGDGNTSGVEGCFDGGACFTYTSTSNGVYKTTNGGSTWIKLPDFIPTINNSVYFGRNIIIHPNDPSILYAATSLGLFKTVNGGITWEEKDSVNIWDVAFKPGSPDTIYYVGDNFLKKSNDNGNFINLNVPDLNQAERIAIATTTANPNKVVLFAGNDSLNSCIGVFVSTNSGITFTKFASSSSGHPNLFHNFIGSDVALAQQNYNCTVAISPLNENEIYVGGLCVWKSTNGGQNWNQISAYRSSDSPYMHPDIHYIGFNPINNKFYSGNDGGVYVYFEEEWLSKFKGLSTSMFYHFEEENDEDDTWGGTQDNGVLERDGSGLDFENYAGGDGFDVMTDHPSRSLDGNSENVFFTLNESIIKDCGVGFDQCDISVPGNTNFFGNLAMHPEDNDKIYVGYESKVYYSYDAGSTWLSSNNTPGNWSICAGKTNPSRIYASGSRDNMTGIWRAENYFTWTQINSNLTDIKYDSTKITDIEINRDNDDIVYITCAGVVDSSKVYMSIDAGATWTNISYNLPNIPVFCILRDSFDGLYIGTSIGVYYKRASQEYWEPFYNGLPAVPITQLVFEEEGSIFVHCSTFGRGLWRTLKYQNDCQTNLTLNGNPQGTNYWEASNDINSTQNIKGPGTKIIYSAGNKITLTNGMKVEAGAKFRGVSQPCGSEIQNP